jgi:hypothetical protein
LYIKSQVEEAGGGLDNSLMPLGFWLSNIEARLGEEVFWHTIGLAITSQGPSMVAQLVAWFPFTEPT